MWKYIRACRALLPARGSRTIGAGVIMPAVTRVAEDGAKVAEDGAKVAEDGLPVRTAPVFVINCNNNVFLWASALGEK